MLSGRAPGVYKQVVEVPAAQLVTGVPAFLGYAERGPVAGVDRPEAAAVRLGLASDFAPTFGAPRADGYLAYAVRGFFENGGQLCYVVRLDDGAEPLPALQAGLAVLAALETLDLLCAPDIMRPGRPAQVVQALQAALLDHCDALGDRFALLDGPPAGALPGGPAGLRKPVGTNGALYFPWLKVQGGQGDDARLFVPPCGHVAGAYASTDRAYGVHKAPANVALSGVLDLEYNLSDADQGPLNEAGINCLRAFPGRGIRIWGARTVSADTAWRYVTVRRLFITAGRWVARNLTDVAFEPNEQRLWARIVRDLTAYFTQLFTQGALKGRSPQEAFYVKCDAETNPPEVRDAGNLVTEIGLAPALPNEFIIVRIIQGAGGTTISRPAAGG